MLDTGMGDKIAHVMAIRGSKFEDEEILNLTNSKGMTVKYYMDAVK